MQAALILLSLLVLGGLAVWNWPNPVRRLKYKHPERALGVGPVWSKEQGPPLHYMYVWKEGERLNMEFRNLPGVVIACYWGVAPELSESLKKLVDKEKSQV
jgi:hypothetical protein